MEKGLNLSGFCVFVSLNANGFAGTFAGARVGGGALAPDGEPATVTQPAVAVDRLEAFEVGLKFAPQVALDDDFALVNSVDDGTELLLGKVFRANVGVNVRSFQNLASRRWPNAINVRKRCLDTFVARNINTKKSWHIDVKKAVKVQVGLSALLLFVARVFADDADNVFPLNDAAGLAEAFD